MADLRQLPNLLHKRRKLSERDRIYKLIKDNKVVEQRVEMLAPLVMSLSDFLGENDEAREYSSWRLLDLTLTPTELRLRRDERIVISKQRPGPERMLFLTIEFNEDITDVQGSPLGRVYHILRLLKIKNFVGTFLDSTGRTLDLNSSFAELDIQSRSFLTIIQPEE